MPPKILEIDQSKLPKHIAIIMDGNGRWAQNKGAKRAYGHEKGIDSVNIVCETCAKLGIEYLTLFSFSTENWNRPLEEVSALMTLFLKTLESKIDLLVEQNIKLKTLGDLSYLPQKLHNKINNAVETTKSNKGLTLQLAINYSGRWEITNTTKRIAKDIENKKISADSITEDIIDNYLNTNDIPDPELLIRTSGEMRISNFLLWQIAYSELYITETLWPDFDEKELKKAILNFQNRERRFGMISEQIEEK